MLDHEKTLPGVKHKFIALLSGGKDSCFNLIHCLANGHEIVAIATLQPEPGIDELDSHMYQSIGTQLLPLIAKAIPNPRGLPGGVPLYTHVIKGKAVEQGPEYGNRTRGGEGSGTHGDETEDLTELLKTVLSHHPEATALSSGAILSNYQRLRIEHVCGRLGLVSLAYLWQSQQTPLLESMFRAGLKAVLVKVAGVGLGVDTVGQDLESMMPRLRRLEREYGSHPAGEGGEYETITLDTPVFSHRLRLTKAHTVITDPEPFPVAYLKVDEAELEEKVGWTPPSLAQLRELLGLAENVNGLDHHIQELLESIEPARRTDVALEQTREAVQQDVTYRDAVRIGRKGRWFAVSVDGRTLGNEDVGVELKIAFDKISQTLREHRLSLPLHAAHVTLLISSMSLFAPANEVYKTYFGTSPPSRATVAVPLPAGQRIRLEVIGFDDTSEKGGRPLGDRRALHVQGLSYWAPANIGPYSQAVIVNERVQIAGQIPLIPASLTLPPYPVETSPYPHQAALALQHVGRVVDALRSKSTTGGGWDGWAESCTAWRAEAPLSGEGGLDIVREAWTLWAEEHDWEDVPVAFLKAKELPRGALVEFQVNLHTGRRDHRVEEESIPVIQDEIENDEDLRPVTTASENAAVRWESCSAGSGSGRGFRGIMFIRGVNHSLSDLRAHCPLERILSIKAYHLLTVDENKLRLSLESACEGLVAPCITYIPVQAINDREGQSASIALEMIGL